MTAALSSGKSKIALALLAAVVATLSVGYVGFFYQPLETDAAWYSTGGTWLYRKQITIDHTKVSGASSLSSFPVLISSTAADFKTGTWGGHMGKDDGTDLLFTSSDGSTKIAHEIEKYASTTGELVAWVNIASLSPSTDTVIYIYYGNASASDMQTVAPTKTAVWNDNYKGVWHLNSSSSLTNSTAVANTLTNSGGSDTTGNGATGNAQQYTGTAYAYTSTIPTTATTNVTVEAWTSPSTLPQLGIIVANGNEAGGYAMTINNCNGNSGSKLCGGFFGVGNLASTYTTPAANVWHHMVMILNSTAGSFQFYVDGQSAGSPGGSGPLTPVNRFIVGAWNNVGPSYTPGNFFQGKIDEVRISNTVRTADWIATEYNNQSSPSTFYSLGNEGTNTSVKINASQNNRLTEGLVGLWSFDGPDLKWETGLAMDKSGNGNNGTLVGMATATSPTAGKLGQALYFNGTNQNVNIPDNNNYSVNTTNQLTVAAWIYINSLGSGNKDYISKGSGSNYEWAIESNSSSLQVNIWDSAGNLIAQAFDAAEQGELVAGQWLHVALVANLGTNQLLLYRDGVAGTPATITGTYTNGTAALRVGERADGANDVTAKIDDVRVYNRALSAADVKRLYDLGKVKINASQNNRLTEGLVGLWSFDGPDLKWETGLAMDKSGNGNNGTLVGMATATSPTAGKLGQALSFNGSTDYVNMGDPATGTLDFGTGDFSLSVWFYLDSNGAAYKSIINKGASGTAGYGMEISDIGRLTGSIQATGGTNQHVAAAATAVTTGQWYHGVVVFDRDDQVHVYLNGALGTSATYGAGNTNSVSNAVNATIGIYQNGTSFPFDGTIDDARIYNRALSAADVKELYNLGRVKQTQ